MKHFILTWIYAALVLAGALRVAHSTELIMVEQHGCEWCEVWEEEVGVVYDKTSEGRIAPIRRIDIHDPLPSDLKFIKGLIFTPTFVLVDSGKEIGKIRGYPGEDFFWGLLKQLIDRLPAPGGSNTSTQTPTKQGGAIIKMQNKKKDKDNAWPIQRRQ